MPCPPAFSRQQRVRQRDGQSRPHDSFAYDTGLPPVVRNGCALVTLSSVCATQLGNATSVTSTEFPVLPDRRRFFQHPCLRCFEPLREFQRQCRQHFTCAYDSLDRVVRVTNPNGNDTTYIYDLLDDCLAKTGYAGSSLASALAPNVSSGDLRHQLALPDSHRSQRHTTSYAYDSARHCTTITEADGTHPATCLDPRSNLMEGLMPTAPRSPMSMTCVTGSYTATSPRADRLWLPHV